MSATTDNTVSPAPPLASPPSAGRVRLWFRVRPSKRWIEVGTFAAGEELWLAERLHVPKGASIRFQFDLSESEDVFCRSRPDDRSPDLD